MLASIYMDDFEQKAISTAPPPPEWWNRYVNVKIKKIHTEDSIAHLNTIDDDIKWTNEPEIEGSLAFLDCYTVRQEDESIKTSVYRKLTHTHQPIPYVGQQPPYRT